MQLSLCLSLSYASGLCPAGVAILPSDPLVAVESLKFHNIEWMLTYQGSQLG